MLLELTDAIRRQVRVSIRYGSPRGGPSERDIDPYGVVVVGQRWYLTGFDHHRHQIRTFRVDRIGGVTIREEPAPIPVGFDPVATISRSLARVPWRWRIEIVADATGEDVRQHLPAHVAELVEDVDGTHVHLGADDLDGAARMLASMPWSFTVLRPAELREAIRAHAARLLDATTG